MERVGLGGWIAAFQQNLPANCSSIAMIRKTSPQDLHKLGFKLSAAHLRQVQRALHKEPLATELAAALQPAQPRSPEGAGRHEEEPANESGRDSTSAGVDDTLGQLDGLDSTATDNTAGVDMSIDINASALDEDGGGSGGGDDVEA